MNYTTSEGSGTETYIFLCSKPLFIRVYLAFVGLNPHGVYEATTTTNDYEVYG